MLLDYRNTVNGTHSSNHPKTTRSSCTKMTFRAELTMCLFCLISVLNLPEPALFLSGKQEERPAYYELASPQYKCVCDASMCLTLLESSNPLLLPEHKVTDFFLRLFFTLSPIHFLIFFVHSVMNFWHFHSFNDCFALDESPGDDSARICHG